MFKKWIYPSLLLLLIIGNIISLFGMVGKAMSLLFTGLFLLLFLVCYYRFSYTTD